MKKMKLVLAAAMAAVTLSACGSNSTAPQTTAASTAAESTAATEAATEAEKSGSETTGETTAAAEGIVTEGDLDVNQFETPVLVTSFGQSTDAAMLDTVMKRLGVDYVYNATASGEEIGDNKTVIICVGASTKGLGAAGISEDEETARATSFMEALKGTDAKVVLVHIGGETRRGGLSDSFADLVLGDADYMVVKEDGNADGKFTDAAKEAGVPITLIQSTKDTIEVFTNLFVK